MDISYIKEFLVLSDICNYKKASDALFLSQTTLFHHIKALENEFGVPLFCRAGKRICLSEYGELFQPYARAIIENSETFQQEITERKANTGQRILIGSQYRITNLIRQFKNAYSNYMVYDLDAFDAETALYQSGYELAFIRDLDNSEGKYHVLPYASDSIAVAVPVSHPLALRKSVSFSELKDEEFILYFTPQGKESQEMALCRKAGFKPRISATVSNGSEAAKLVHDGLGLTILLKNSFQAHDDVDVVLLDVDPPLTCEVSLCWRKDVQLSEGALAFLNFVKEFRH